MDLITVTRDIAAPPDAVFELVTDLTRMGEWSPENEGGAWTGDATGPALGATFSGKNRNGNKTWTTTCTVTRYEPSSGFTFEVTSGPFPISTWAFDITPTETGCRVVHSAADRRNWVIRKLGNLVSGVSEREAHNRSNMEQTLAAMAEHLEHGAAPKSE
jgi:uncharacterized protein YndB with AHSA1/START domain